ncbi:MAG: CNNM domain-containing protein [Mariprofundaceae bacterium]|nr:CNNM domain-containing protein [Mariprofundaceae bacterium]
MNDISLPVAIASLFVLLLLSAFFSGSETAMTRARKVRMQLLVDKGFRGAARAQQILMYPERMLATILLGNNFVNIAASALATAVFVQFFGEIGILYATVAMTVIVLIFAEILPKSIAVAHAEVISCRVSWLLRGFTWCLLPLVSVLMLVIQMLQRLLKVPTNVQTEMTHQELVGIIDLGAQSGLLDKAREQMLMRSLHLHEVAVKSLMTPRTHMVMLDAGQSIAKCLAMVITHPHSRYPIYHENRERLLGIVHLRDLIRHQDKSCTLLDTMVWKNILYIPTNKHALAQIVDFQNTRQHMAVVVDEYGDIEGLITLEDIIEEIVGEIEDESDKPVDVDMWPQPDGSVIVVGTTPLHDINQALGTHVPEDGATTIGGAVVEVLGSPAEACLCLEIEDVQIEVLSIRNQWIRRLCIRKKK